MTVKSELLLLSDHQERILQGSVSTQLIPQLSCWFLFFDGSCTLPSDSSTQLDAFIMQSYPHFPAQSPTPSPSYLQTGLQSSRDPSSSVFCSFVFLAPASSPSLSLSPSVSQVQPPPQKLRSGLSYFWRPCSLLLLSDLLPNSSQMGPSQLSVFSKAPIQAP